MDARRVFCPICSHADSAEFAPLDQNPSAVECLRCGLGIETELKVDPDFYKRAVYDGARNHGAGDNRWSRFHHDSAVAADRVQQYLGNVAATWPMVTLTDRRWVDVGCGNAAMLTHLSRQGWSVMGVEADEESAREVTNLLGITVLPFSSWSAFSRTVAGGNHVVSFVDVLEHFLDPVGAVMAASRQVEVGGLIIVEAPDLEKGKVSFSNWKHRRIGENTEHIWHFTLRSLEALRAKYLPDFQTVKSESIMQDRLQVIWRKSAAPDAVTDAPVVVDLPLIGSVTLESR